MVRSDKLDDLYQELILDHYKNPRNRHYIEEADIKAEADNPFCGDEIALQLKLANSHVGEVGYQGKGCSICRASGSMLSEAVVGRTLEEIEELAATFKGMMRGRELSKIDTETLGELKVFLDILKYPIRIKCALLAWVALEEGIQKFRSRA
ncbi:MAG: SUF system NifU family Fe-S cluster assembly protein [Chloroflexi bacterium]|nr:SUF system NifU family Fe-S cluster assembly protein [Chloroflexota bacterium]